MKSLELLAIEHGTDKGGPNGWGYTPHYEAEFAAHETKIRNVLEIGICGGRDIPNNTTGASLKMWRDYFPDAEVWGIDVDGRWMVRGEPRITTICADAYNKVAVDRLLQDIWCETYFDFICDDAVHDPMAQVWLLYHLWPALAWGGLYAIEDVCPYKLPNNDLSIMSAFFPPDAAVKIIETHKAERLILLRKLRQ